MLPELPANAPTREYARIREMLSFLHTYYKEEISVTEIAAAAHISKTECLRCFHRFVGEPPYQYLIKYRLHMSTALLTDTNHPVTQIASDTGFASASTYIRYFRKWYGCTPKEYRENICNKATLHSTDDVLDTDRFWPRTVNMYVLVHFLSSVAIFPDYRRLWHLAKLQNCHHDGDHRPPRSLQSARYKYIRPLPRKTGRIKSSGTKKMICLVRDRKIPFAGLPMDVKKVDVIGCKASSQIKNR